MSTLSSNSATLLYAIAGLS